MALMSYCLKTKQQEEIFECVIKMTSRGGYTLQGVTKDGYKTSKIVSKVDAEKFIAEGLATKGF